MTIISSREFNQHLGQAQKAAQIEPVIITNRGEPVYVLMSYAEYEKHFQEKAFYSIADALADTDPSCAEIELELPARHNRQRRLVDLED
ncbi:prevent-host-death protein [Gallibacterium salpingitidis]|uniref:type II toxin-antitoxin system Phd/YefM family antitoxin n=1 Tax=Gallibacterium salpingitidis TaxID=505341 RepID=UPI000805D180|nr:type II toxin-antitoxin system Phd/YefM family antitoxin [Gallibacterium salpingitidis]OBX07797.1 prevent-host-death protein [Gallibacterium salpingitidis]WKT00878.1 type II toxin-antitoxin system Phd/YefM family antitoxin [Gallibacterium salpingitidis]